MAKKSSDFKGVFTALISPFVDGRVDYVSLEKLVKDQIQKGIDGFVINGTTGESPTVSTLEVSKIFETVKNLCGPQHVLIVGAGGNNTGEVVIAAKAAEKMGADAILSVVPYYNKPPQRGLVKHFTEIANNVSIPIILYNVPGRTITALSIDSIIELAKHPRIIGIKEASGDIDFAKKISTKLGNDFVLLSGDDETYSKFLEAGGHGVISVATHVIPTEMKKIKALISSGEGAKAHELLNTYIPMIRMLFSEANPIPVKAAMKIMGYIQSAELRLPLVEMDKALQENLHNELKQRNMI